MIWIRNRVNDEVKVYNRELKKYLKVFDNTCVLEVDSNRDLFTRHGLHMNQKGKEHMAKKIVMAIQVMLNEKKSDPIMMKNKEDLRTDNEPEKKQTVLHHISSNRKSAERFNLVKDESTRNKRKVIVAHEQECDGEEEDANKDRISDSGTSSGHCRQYPANKRQ